MKNLKMICAWAVFAIAAAGCGDRQAGVDTSEEPGAATEAPAQDSAASNVEPTTATVPDDPLLGPALADPTVYFGVYASSDAPARSWFIAEARRPAYAERAAEIPPGHLMLGAMFGDVAPWPLKTRSPIEFVQATPGPGESEPTAIEFRLDSNGKATGFRFVGGVFSADTWLARTGDLPDGW